MKSLSRNLNESPLKNTQNPVIRECSSTLLKPNAFKSDNKYITIEEIDIYGNRTVNRVLDKRYDLDWVKVHEPWRIVYPNGPDEPPVLKYYKKGTGINIIVLDCYNV